MHKYDDNCKYLLNYQWLFNKSNELSTAQKHIKKILKLGISDIQYPWTLVYIQINNQIRDKTVAKKGPKWENFHCFVTHFLCQYIANFPHHHSYIVLLFLVPFYFLNESYFPSNSRTFLPPYPNKDNSISNNPNCK